MAKTLFRLLLKLVLLPVSLVLLLAKGAICLALKLVELPLGLFIWLIGIIIVFCIFNQRWRDVGVGALIMGVVYGFCTHEGFGLSSTESDIKKTAKGVSVTKGLAINGSSVDGAKAKVQEWV